MKILMVRPRPTSRTIGLQHLMIVEPLELEVLASLKREEDEVVILDMIIEKKPLEVYLKKYTPDVLCVTGYITNVDTMISYCQTAKRFSPETTTIVGGVHCEICPEDLESKFVDYRVVRNAAVIFTDLLNYIDKKTEFPEGVLKQSESLDETALPPFDFRVPFPAREYTAKYRSKYFYIFHKNVAMIKTSFGCPFTCSFCFCSVITAQKFNQRPMDEVIAELKQIKEKEIYIVDDDFLHDKKRMLLFVSELKKHNIKKHFLVYGRADFIANNPDIMHELKEVGLKTVIVGFESFSDAELDLYNKKTNVEMYQKTMEVLHREQMDCFATIIIPPNYGKDDFRNMVKAIKDLGIHYVNLQPLTPLPKTGVSFSDDVLIIDRKEYDLWDLAHLTIQPTKLSVADFYRQILKAYTSILYQPRVLWMYLTTYSPSMLYRMFVGGFRVTKQYKKKIKESEKYA